MIIRKAYQHLKIILSEIYNEKEAANIADLVLEKISGLSRIDRIMMHKEFALNQDQLKLLHYFSDQLLKHKPVQYALHEAWFAGMKLYVDENVLIPRPETEELVNWIFEDAQFINGDSTLNILDIGTGSGCIAIALKRKLVNSEISALDISQKALQVALLNAEANNTSIKFFEADINQTTKIKNLPLFDIIVSNPPYITENEIIEMSKNVVLYEPHAALFVPNANPLLFYNSISTFAQHHLKKNGCLYFEINESYGNEIATLLYNKKFQSVEIKKDLQGKNRMLKTVLSS